MAKLYPPIIEEIVPAFYGTGGLSVPYTLNRAVGISDINGFALIVKSTITNKEICSKKIYSGVSTTNLEDNSSLSSVINFSFSEEEIKQFKMGGFYKIQIAFINIQGVIGYFSNTAIVKYIGKEKPVLTVSDSTNSSESFLGTYKCEDITEKMYSYRFKLIDNEGNIVEESGEQLHDATSDVGLTQKQTWNLKRVLDNGANYNITFEITTINNLTLSISEVITAHKDPQGYAPYGIELLAKVNQEEGYVELGVKSKIPNDVRELIYGKFEIFKTSSKDNFQSKYKVAFFELQNQDLYEKRFKDFTVESGYSYIYVLQQRNDYGIYSEEIYSNEGDPLYVYYEHIFLYDGEKQLKIAYNPKIQSFKDTILEQKIDTIGSQYPFVFRNNIVKYKEVPISGLISYTLDPENLFMNDYEIWEQITPSLAGDYVNTNINKEAKWTHNLTDENIAAEREFKLRVMEWLENGKPKLFKSPTEGNYILRLMNVSLTPVDTLGRMLHSFTATGYEIEDASKYSFADLLQVDSSSKYIGYRTIPLYDFPSFYYVANNSIVNNLKFYEIIANRGLEWVTGFRIEDAKPHTQFTVTIERQLEKYVLDLRVGATGVYYFPSRLGFHITSIRLKNSSWQTDNFGADIINNKGQITYIYERQAKHNNFNDITKISLNKQISYPLISSWYTNARLNEQLVSTDLSKPLYELKESGYEKDLYIQMGYFKTVVGTTIDVYGNEVNVYEVDENGDIIIRLLICSVDYKYDEENQKYYTKNTNPIKEIVPVNNKGCPKKIGDPIYKYEVLESLFKNITDTTPTGITDSFNNKLNYVDKESIQQDPVSLEIKSKYFVQTYSDKNENQIELLLMNKDKNPEGWGQFNLTQPFKVTTTFGKISSSTGADIILDIVKKENFYENPFYVKVYKDIETDNWYDYDWEDPLLQVILQKQNIGTSFLDITNTWLYNQLPEDYIIKDENSDKYRINWNENYQFMDENGKLKTLQFWDSNNEINQIFKENYLFEIFKKLIEQKVIQTPIIVKEALYSNNYMWTSATDSGVFVPTTFTLPKNIIQEKYYPLQNITGDYYKKQENVNLYCIDFELIQVFYQEKLEDIGLNAYYPEGVITLKDLDEDNGYQYTERSIVALMPKTAESSPNNLINLTKNFNTGAQENLYGFDNEHEKYVDKINYAWSKVEDVQDIGADDFNTYIENHKFISCTDFLNDYNDNNKKYIINYLIQGNISGDSNYQKINTLYETYGVEIFEKRNVKNLLGVQGYTQIENFPESNNFNTDNYYIHLQGLALKRYCQKVTPKDNEIVIVVNDDLTSISRIDLTNRFSYHMDFSEDPLKKGWTNVAAIYLGKNVRGFLTFDRKQYAYNAISIDGVRVPLSFEKKKEGDN